MKSDFSPSRRAWNVIMTAVVWAAAVLVIALTVGVIGLVLVRGIPHISWGFLSTTASILKGTDGILPAILNTFYVILLTLLIVLPLGVGAAVYLTEYASNRKLIEVIEFTNETLAGIPSIIYGLVGMLVFAQTMGFKTCLLSGSLTLVVMNLPTIIRTTQESLKTVPQGYREGAMGLGAGKCHIICTMRSKQDYVLSDKNGKMVPEKVGLKAVQRDNVDYEFTAVLDIAMNHKATTSKDRTGLFTGRPEFTITPAVGQAILKWCNMTQTTQSNPSTQNLHSHASSLSA